MAVIAKMNMSTTAYADGTKVNLHCVYDTDLAKAENEDVRFTKASPWGNAEMTVKPGFALPAKDEHGQHRPIYLMFTPVDDLPMMSSCFAAVPVICSSILDTGTQKQIELAGQGYGEDSPIPADKQITTDRYPHFNLKMGIDNPAASIQFEPQKRYWIAMMDTDDQSEVVDVARGYSRGACAEVPAEKADEPQGA